MQKRIHTSVDFTRIRYWVIDVDGTMTDGGIYYDNCKNEIKKFNVRDAAGIFAAREAGMSTIVMTGRECAATRHRMDDLRIDYLYQNVKDKYDFLGKIMLDKNISQEEIAYIGDDLNDYDAMHLVGFIACPSDACEEIRQIADYVSDCPGGNGAVRDAISYVLKKQNRWDESIRAAYQLRN